MDRDLVWPVLGFSLGVLLLTDFIATTIDVNTGLPVVYAEAISNGGIALVLVAVLMLFEWFPYERYREQGIPHAGTDVTLVTLTAIVVTVLVVSGLEAAGLGNLGTSIGPFPVDISGTTSDVAAFGAGVYAFYIRNREYYVSPSANTETEE